MANVKNETTKNVANETKNNKVNNAEKVDAKAPKDQSKKVSAKVAVKATNTISRFVKAERIGVNATIRILLDAVKDGNEDAINTLCALCDVPTDMAFAITLDDVRKAVNEHYPYVIVTESGRKINVRAKSVHYSTASASEEDMIDARKRVVKGFFASEVTDYLTELTSATKARAKGIKQKSVNEARIYEDNQFSKVTDIETVDVLAAKAAHTFNWSKVNVWRKHPSFGYYM